MGRLCIYAAAPAAIALVPTAFLESAGPVCLITNILHTHCPGCGITRAVSCIFHGEFADAFHCNKLVVVVFPLLCHVYFQALKAEYKIFLKQTGGNIIQEKEEGGLSGAA